MSTWAAGARTAAIVGACLLAAACQKTDEGALPDSAGTGKAQAASTAAAPAPAVVAPATAPPAAEQTQAIDAALAAAQAYNAEAAKTLIAIGQDEARIRASAKRALDASRGAETASEGQRQALGSRVTAARREAEAARDRLAEGQAKLRTDADAQITAIETNLEACGAAPELATYAGCQGLEAEHALVLQNIEALSKRYETATAAFGAERAKLEEASAAVALAALR